MKCLTRTDIQVIGRRIREVERVTITGHNNNNHNNIHHNTEVVTLLTTTTAPIINRGDEGVADTSHLEIEVPVLAGVGTISRVTATVATTITPLKILNHNSSHNTINNILRVHRHFILHNNISKPGVDHTNPGVTGADLRDI